MAKHISAKSKKEPLPYDRENHRLRSLFPDHTSSKAERNFWSLVRIDCEKKTTTISRNELLIIDNLDKEYWRLQDEIEDENIDIQIRHSLIDQQHDILDEQEKIYLKYLPNEISKNK